MIVFAAGRAGERAANLDDNGGSRGAGVRTEIGAVITEHWAAVTGLYKHQVLRCDADVVTTHS